MIEQRLCTVACTADFRKSLPYHDLMKADLRISVKDYRRAKSLKIHLAQVNYSKRRQFLVKMNGARWPLDGRPVSITKVLASLRKAIVKSFLRSEP